MTQQMTVYKRDDSPILNPKGCFFEKDLEKLSPYQIFTGEAFRVVVSVPHECDCEYCRKDWDEDARFFTKKEDLDEELKRIENDDNEELVRVENWFFARAVKQEEK